MSNIKQTTITPDSIQNRIITIRNTQVILDQDLAVLYGVELKRLNEQVKRNIERFPEPFCFQLTAEEAEALRSQNATLENGRGKHRKYLPFVFSEQGVAMLSAVLRSETAVAVSIQIMNAFIVMRRFLRDNAQVFQRLETLELRQIETDKTVEKVLTAIEDKTLKPKQGIFYDGQVFDAWQFVSDLVRTAKKSIILIDNYVDDSVLSLFAKKKKGVSVTILTKIISKQLELDVKKFNEQYASLSMKQFNASHDRFMVIDDADLYHFGASLKDLGKKWFAFSKMEMGAVEMLNKVKM